MILRTDLRRDSPAESLIVSSVNAISSVRNPPDHKKRLERFEMKEIPYEKQLTTSSESSLASSADDSSGAATVSAPTESGSSALSYSCSCSRTSSSALQLQQCPVSTDDNDSLSISSIDSLHDALEVEFHTDLDNEMHYSSLKVPPPSSPPPSEREFMALRFTYLLVTLVIMLADGLQGKFQVKTLNGTPSLCDSIAVALLTLSFRFFFAQEHICMYSTKAMDSRWLRSIA
jgi:hypothetical protein